MPCVPSTQVQSRFDYLLQVLASKATEAVSNGDLYGDFLARSFFESIFLFADKDNKGELVVDDLKTLFQVRSSSGYHTKRSNE